MDGGELAGELCVAEKEAQGGAEIVHLFGGEALDLGVSRREGPGVFAVEEEELAGGFGVGPAHAAGLAEEQGAGLGFVQTKAGVGFGEAGAERAETVVVSVNGFEDGGVSRGEFGILGAKRGG